MPYLKPISFILLVLGTCTTLLAQDQKPEWSRTSLYYGLGYGQAFDVLTRGYGGVFHCGVNQELGKKQKFRLSLQMSLGSYSGRLDQNSDGTAFYSLNLTPAVYADLLRFRSLSIVGGTGFVWNNMGGYQDAFRFSGPYYFNYWNYGIYLSGGLRFNPKSFRLAFELLPINFYSDLFMFWQNDLRLVVLVKLHK